MSWTSGAGWARMYVRDGKRVDVHPGPPYPGAGEIPRTAAAAAGGGSPMMCAVGGRERERKKASDRGTATTHLRRRISLRIRYPWCSEGQVCAEQGDLVVPGDVGGGRGRRQTADGAGGGDAEIATKGCDAG